MSILHKVIDKVQTIISRTVNRLYDWWMRKRLKNKDFTLICSNCIGGIIYHRLGLQFRSPTINLWMGQRDCIKLVAQLDRYRAQQLRFVETGADHPVAMLDDIMLHFNHSKHAAEAAAQWYRRMERIRTDNLFLILYDREGLTDRELLQLEQLPCKAYVVLCDAVRPGIRGMKRIKPSKNPNGAQYLDRRWHGLHTFETQFDFVKWLNQ